MKVAVCIEPDDHDPIGVQAGERAEAVVAVPRQYDGKRPLLACFANLRSQ